MPAPAFRSDEGSLRRRTREALRELGIRPRRRWGQNFLVEEPIAERIVEAAGIDGHPVVEVGPGLGALTGALARRASRVVAVEVDPILAGWLRRRFADFTNEGNVEIFEADALDVDFRSVLPGEKKGVAVANLPYNVGSQVLLRLIDQRERFARFVVMFQAEVAARLVARPGTEDYGLFTVFAGLHTVPKVLFRVSAGAFVPKPEVDSAVVSLEIRDEPAVRLRSEAQFREIVRAGFQQRRKTLRKALSGLLTEEHMKDVDIDAGRRAETLDLEEFARLANCLAERRESSDA